MAESTAAENSTTSGSSSKIVREAATAKAMKPSPQELLKHLSLEDMLALITGHSLWKLADLSSAEDKHPLVRSNVPQLTVSDGPHGIRKPLRARDLEASLHVSHPATCFPTAAALACSWDVDLLRTVGQALALEAAHYNVQILLAPGINLKRHPAGGRNFEYFSEDPILTGHLAAAYINGVQQEQKIQLADGTAATASTVVKIGCSVKHFAINNQEAHRLVVNAVVDERTARELYLRSFEYVVKHSQPATVMCAYNQVNGVYCSEHKVLLTDILRHEWNFGGVAMTDWGATNDRVAAIRAGNDLEMPGSYGCHDSAIRKALGVEHSSSSSTIAVEEASRSRSSSSPEEQAVIDDAEHEKQKVADPDEFKGIEHTSFRDMEQHLDACCLRMLKMIQTYPPAAATDEQAAKLCHVNWQAHHELAHTVALDCAVLLRNENILLPLQRGTSVALIGDFAREHARYQGMGSSAVSSRQVVTAFDEIQRHTQEVFFAAGYHVDDDHVETVNQELVDEAVAQAKKADVVILFIGLPEIMESEGFDRPHLGLPAQHNALVQAVCRVHHKVVVVLSNGGVVELPWFDHVQAIMEGYLLGQAGGAAIVDLIFGVQSPCGKLAETFPIQMLDIPANQFFPGSETTVEYREGLNVGYRYFDTANKPVRYPFGHGLSYTTFQYDNLQLEQVVLEDDDNSDNKKNNIAVDVQFTLMNTGTMAGKEVCQCYVQDVESTVYRPQQELRAFQKVELQPGQKTRVKLRLLTQDAFVFYDVGFKKWVMENGEFEIRIGSSSRDIRLQGTVRLEHGINKASTLAQASYPAVIMKDSADIDDDDEEDAKKKVCPMDDASFDQRFASAAPGFCRSTGVEGGTASAGGFHRNSLLKHVASKRLVGWILRKHVFREAGGKDIEPDPHQQRLKERMLNEIVDNMPLRSLVLFSEGNLNFTLLDALIALCNYQFLTSFALFGVAFIGMFRPKKRKT